MATQGEIKGIPNPQDLLEAGLAYLEGGVNLIPVNARKTPADPPLPYQKWKKYQKERVTKDLLRKWANSPGVHGWAMVCGKISGGLTILDFDEPGFYENWKAKGGNWPRRFLHSKPEAVMVIKWPSGQISLSAMTNWPMSRQTMRKAD